MVTPRPGWCRRGVADEASAGVAAPPSPVAPKRATMSAREALARGSMIPVAALAGMTVAELVALAQGRAASTLPGTLASFVMVAGVAWWLRDERVSASARRVVESVSMAELRAEWDDQPVLDATVAAVGEALDRAGHHASAMPLAIHVGDEAVEVFWDRPPPPVSPTFEVATTGWVWRASAARLAARLEAGIDHTAAPLLPALVRLGGTGLGELFVNLEACRLVNLVGDQRHALRAFEHLIGLLAVPSVDVIVVGARDGDGPTLKASTVKWVDADAAVMEVRRRRTRLRQHLEARAWTSVLVARRRDPDAHAWRPLVVLIPDPSESVAALEPVTRGARADRSGVICVFVNRSPDGESVAVACGPGVLHLAFLNGTTVVLPEDPTDVQPSVAAGDAHDAFRPPAETDPPAVIEAETAVADGVERLPVEVCVLGAVEVRGVSAPLGGKNTELIAYLASHREGVSDERIKAVLWPKRPVTHQSWLNRVSTCRHTLGTTPDGELVLPHFEDGIGRLAASVRTDVETLDDALRDTIELDAAAALPILRTALARVRGRPFDERAGYEWAFAEFHAAHAERVIIEVAHRLAHHALTVGDWRTARWAAEQGLQAVPASEVLAQDRMRAFAASGDLRGVDRALRDLLASLEATDIAEVQPDTRALYEELCRPRAKLRVR